MTDFDGYQDQLQSDAQFLCSDHRLDTELLDRLVLQLNRIYPQILSDKEAHRFRTLSVPTKVRLAELLKHLHGRGEDACHEFYRALHIHAEEVYSYLPTRVKRRGYNQLGMAAAIKECYCYGVGVPGLEMADTKPTNNVAVHQERSGLNQRGPTFFLSCFCFVVGIAILYYYGEAETLRCTGGFLHCSAERLSKNARCVLTSYVEVGMQK